MPSETNYNIQWNRKPLKKYNKATANRWLHSVETKVTDCSEDIKISVLITLRVTMKKIAENKTRLEEKGKTWIVDMKKN